MYVSLYSFRDWSVNAVRDLERSLHVAIGFTLALHGHMSSIRVSRSRRAHADMEYIQ